MDTLLNIALLGGLFYLMMRFGCGAHVMGRGHSQTQPGDDSDAGHSHAPAPRWIAPAKDIDPVCGKEVSTDHAKPSVYDGQVYYFCSRECREIFEAAPAQHPKQELGRSKTEMEKSHV